MPQEKSAASAKFLPLVNHKAFRLPCDDLKVALTVCGSGARLLLPTRTGIGRSLGHGFQLSELIVGVGVMVHG